MPNNSPKIGFIIFGLPLVILIIFIWSWINSPLIVTVTGQGEINVQVTTSTLTFSVVSDGEDAAGAIGNTRTKANNLKSILKDTGLKEEDIVESQVTVVPASSLVAGATGYKSSIILGGRNIPAGKLDSLISVLYTNGASLVSQPAIDTTDKKELEKQAVALAMTDAQKQADMIAKNNSKFIKKVVSIIQSSNSSTTVTSKESFVNPNSQGTGKIVALVSVSYKMW